MSGNTVVTLKPSPESDDDLLAKIREVIDRAINDRVPTIVEQAITQRLGPDRAKPARRANQRRHAPKPKAGRSLAAPASQEAPVAIISIPEVVEAPKPEPPPQIKEDWVVMYGTQLWPAKETRYGEYSFNQVRAAVWMFRDTLSWLGDKSSPASRAIMARLSIRWPYEFIGIQAGDHDTKRRIRKVYEIFQLLTRLYEDNPTGECIIPPTPTRESEW